MSKQIKLKPALLGLSLLLTCLSAPLIASRVNASMLTNSMIRLNRMKAGQGTSFRVEFKTVGSGATSVAIDFNGADGGTSWTNSSGVVNGTQSVSSSTCADTAQGGNGSATALPGSLTAAGSSGVVTISNVTALTAATLYCVDLTSATAVTNASASGGPASDGVYHPTITVGSDSTTVAIRTISEDQIVVTATVSPTFNMSFDSTATLALGTLSTTGTSSSSRTVTLSTNGFSGWTLWVKDLYGSANKGSLNSATNSNYKITPGSALGSAAHTLGTSTDDYGLGVTATSTGSGGAGSISVDSAFDSTAGTKIGVLDSANFRRMASANGTANGHTVTFVQRAAISPITPAGNDYTDTLTFVGAGSF